MVRYNIDFHGIGQGITKQMGIMDGRLYEYLPPNWGRICSKFDHEDMAVDYTYIEFHMEQVEVDKHQFGEAAELPFVLIYGEPQIEDIYTVLNELNIKCDVEVFMYNSNDDVVAWYKLFRTT